MKRRDRRSRFSSFEGFWTFYLKEHSNPVTRWMHFAGTNMGIFYAMTALVLGDPRWLLVALVAGYAPAWFAHFFVEKNRPATFQHPFWSLAADFKMCWGLWLGLLGFERDRRS